MKRREVIAGLAVSQGHPKACKLHRYQLFHVDASPSPNVAPPRAGGPRALPRSAKARESAKRIAINSKKDAQH